MSAGPRSGDVHSAICGLLLLAGALFVATAQQASAVAAETVQPIRDRLFVFFEPGSIEVTPAAREIVGFAAAAAADGGPIRLTVSGFAAPAEAPGIATARAAAVVGLLAESGVPPRAIVTRDPAGPTAAAALLSSVMQRRVEIVLALRLPSHGALVPDTPLRSIPSAERGPALAFGRALE